MRENGIEVSPPMTSRARSIPLVAVANRPWKIPFASAPRVPTLRQLQEPALACSIATRPG